MVTCLRPLLPLPFPDPPPGPEAKAAVAGTTATAPVSIAPTSIRRNRILRPLLNRAPRLGDAPRQATEGSAVVPDAQRPVHTCSQARSRRSVREWLSSRFVH